MSRSCNQKRKRINGEEPQTAQAGHGQPKPYLMMQAYTGEPYSEVRIHEPDVPSGLDVPAMVKDLSDVVRHYMTEAGHIKPDSTNTHEVRVSGVPYKVPRRKEYPH